MACCSLPSKSVIGSSAFPDPPRGRVDRFRGREPRSRPDSGRLVACRWSVTTGEKGGPRRLARLHGLFGGFDSSPTILYFFSLPSEPFERRAHDQAT